MYRIITFRRDVAYGDSEPLPPTVEEQFNAWAERQHPKTEIIHFDRQEYSSEYSSHTVLTVLAKFPSFG